MIKHDVKRIFSGIYFVTAVLLVTMVLGLTMLEQKDWNLSIFEILENTAYRVEYLLILAFVTIPYAGCFIDDFAHKSVYQTLVRCDLRKYIISKTVCIFWSSVAATVIGILIYVIFLRITGHEWFSYKLIEYYNINGIGVPDLELWSLIENGHSMIFYTIMGMQIGILAGITSLVSAFLSLFIKNKMMVMVAPIIIVYIMMFYLQGIFGFGENNVMQLFSIFNNYTFWGSHFFIRCCITGLFSFFALTLMIYYRVRRRIRYD